MYERRVERKIAPPYELPFLTSELNDVIMFMNDQGNLEYGKMRREFARNSLKSVIKAQMKILIENNIIIKNEARMEIKEKHLKNLILNIIQQEFFIVEENLVWKES